MLKDHTRVHAAGSCFSKDSLAIVHEMLPFISCQSYYTVSGNLVVCADDFEKPALYKHATIM